VSHGENWIETDRFRTVSDRSVKIVSVEVCGASVVVSSGKPGIEPYCLIGVGEGVLDIAFIGVRRAAIDLGVGEFGIEPDRLVAVGDGAVWFARLIVFQAAVAIERRKIVILPSPRTDRAGAGGHGFVPGLSRARLRVVGRRAMRHER
jgi:hypothetical protein